MATLKDWLIIVPSVLLILIIGSLIGVYVYFSDEVSTDNEVSCVVTGCSGQVCADEEVVTTCEFRPEYACYKMGRCERQASGECDWTQTKELQSCLVDAKINGK